MLRIAVVVLLSLMSSAVLAKDVQLGAVNIRLLTPNKACEADESLPSDQRWVSSARAMIEKNGNTLQAAYADCKQLIAWRKLKLPNLPHTYQYQSWNASAETGIRGEPADEIKSTCADLRAEGKKYAEDDFPNMRDRVKVALKKVEALGSAFMGVLAEEPDACYAANLQQFKLANGSKIKQIALWATVVVKKRVFFFYDFAPYTDEDSVTAVLKDFKPQVAAFLAANR